MTRIDADALAINSSEEIFAGTYDGKIFRSTDNGDSWTAGDSGLTSTPVRALALNSRGDIFAGTDGGGVFRSMNNGDSWIAVKSGLTNTGVHALALNSRGDIFAGTTNGGVFHLMNNGTNWTAVNIGLTNAEVRALAINSSGYIFAGTFSGSGGIFRSTNNGVSWTAVDSGLTNTYVRALAINSCGHIFAGTDGGAFRSTNNGDSWTAVYSGLTNTGVRALAINSSGYIFAGTSGAGVFRSVESTVGDPPSVTTNPATNVSSTSATLNGIVNPNGESTTVKFEYGTTTSYGSEIIATPSPVNGTSPVAVSAPLTGLSPNTFYHYRVVGINCAGTTNSPDQTFTTPCAAPIVNTTAATNVGATSATLNGTVNARGCSTTVKFQYGLTTGYGSEITATQSPVTGSSAVAVSARPTGLTPDTLYHYRVVGGPTSGADRTFTTKPDSSAPTVTTNPATNVSTNSATLNGTVNANGLSTTVKFQYGTTTGYGSEITATQSPVTGSSNVAVSRGLIGLTPNTLYHYRVIGTNSAGPANGADQTFITRGGPPSVDTSAATNVGATFATLNGTVNANGLSTTVKFEYGTTTDYGNEIDATQNPVSGSSDVAVSAMLTGLTLKTLYHYRIVAANSAGDTSGADQTFTTISRPTVTTNAATNVGTTSATLNGTVNANGLSTTVKFQYGTTIGYGSEVNATQSPVTGNSAVAVSAPLNGLTQNTLYHYRVVGTNSAGSANGANQTFTTYPENFPIATNVNFPNHQNVSDYKVTDWRIVGLPGASNRSIKDFISGQQGQDLELFWDNGATSVSNYLIKFNGGSNFTHVAGRAFWLIKRETGFSIP